LKEDIVQLKAIYSTDNFYEYWAKYDKDVYCRNCGGKGLWAESGDGDEEQGPSDFCTKCNSCQRRDNTSFNKIVVNKEIKL